MRSAVYAAVTLLFALPTTVAFAQEPRRLAQPDSVPFELASALVAAGGLGGDPQILVGSMPGWVSSRLKIPTNAIVLGSAFLGSTVLGILTLPDAPEVVIADMKREFTKQGWKSPPPQPSYGGFRPAGFSTAIDGTPTRVTLCGDQQLLTASAVRHRGTATQVTLRVSPTINYSPCNPPQPMAQPQGYTRSQLPTLYNPSNSSEARLAPACSSQQQQFGGNASSASLATTMTGTALLEHYGKQLQDSGWQAPRATNSVVGRSWTKPDSAGVPQEVSLTVTTSARDSTCQEIVMQVRLLRKP